MSLIIRKETQQVLDESQKIDKSLDKSLDKPSPNLINAKYSDDKDKESNSKSFTNDTFSRNTLRNRFNLDIVTYTFIRLVIIVVTSITFMELERGL